MKSFLGSCKLLTFYIKSILPMYVFFWNPAKHILIFDILPSPQFHTSRLKRIITIPFIKVLFCIFLQFRTFTTCTDNQVLYIKCTNFKFLSWAEIQNCKSSHVYHTISLIPQKIINFLYSCGHIYYDDCDYLHTIFTMYLLYTTQNFVFWVNISSKNSFFFLWKWSYEWLLTYYITYSFERFGCLFYLFMF